MLWCWHACISLQLLVTGLLLVAVMLIDCPHTCQVTSHLLHSNDVDHVLPGAICDVSVSSTICSHSHACQTLQC